MDEKKRSFVRCRFYFVDIDEVRRKEKLQAEEDRRIFAALIPDGCFGVWMEKRKFRRAIDAIYAEQDEELFAIVRSVDGALSPWKERQYAVATI